MRTSTKISIMVAVILIVCGLMLSGVAFAIMDGNIEKLNQASLKENTHTVDKSFNSIYIDSESADIQICLSEDDNCYVKCIESDKLYHAVSVDGDTLNIKLVDERKWYEHIGIFFGNMEVTVFLPKTEFDKLYISTLSGNVKVSEEYSFNNAEIHNISGSIYFYASVKNEFTAKTTSGKITADGVSPEKMTVTSTSGAVSISSADSSYISVKNTSGAITLTDIDCGTLTSSNTSGKTLLTNVKATRIESESVSGAIRFSGCDAESIKFKNTSGNISGSLASEKIFIATSTSGKVTVPHSTSGGICEITTVSGSINITIGDQ